MPRCARADCSRWCPDLLVKRTGIGARLDGHWYCSTRCLEASALRRLARPPRLSVRPPAIPPLRLGTLLMHQGAVTANVIREAVAAQRHSGLKLGAQLRAMGAATAIDVLRGLAAQAGVGYLTHVDPVCVREAPGRLSPDAIRALGVVPVEADAHVRRLRVACVAPVPRTSLSALYELTSWTIEPLLVSDEHLEPLINAYGLAVADQATTIQSRTVTDLGDAAACVARAAAGARDVRMRQTHVDPYLWVRLESGTRVEDVLLPVNGGV